MEQAKFWYGADPEAFIFDEDGKAVPSWKYFPDKYNKVSVWSSDDRIKVFHDGAAVEFNGPASDSIEGLTTWMRKALIGTQVYLPERYTIRRTPTITIDKDFMKEAPPDCMVFGCDPAWNAWEGKMSAVEIDATTHPERYAGGHMQMSVSVDSKDTTAGWMFDQEACLEAIKHLDLWLGLPLTVISASPETFQRRKYYGKAGEFRFQDYNGEFRGLEYRVPGPEVWASTETATRAFKAMHHILNNFKEARKSWDTRAEEDIRNAIDTGEGAAKLLQHFPVPA